MILLDEYLVIQQLSQRNARFGQVFLVENQVSKVLKIIKFVPIDAKAFAIEQLYNEAQFQFNHPQIQNSESLISKKEGVYLVKSYHDGIPLETYYHAIKRKEKKEFLLHLATQLQMLLEEIHSLGYVHGDLKPSNLLVTKNKELCIIDFGMGFDTKLPIPKRKTLFSLGYAAPELVLNRLNLVSPAADYFSVGVIFYKLLTGKLPWTHENPSIMTNLQITYPLPRHTKIDSKLHMELASLTHKHQFRTNPKFLEETEMDGNLQAAIDLREKQLSPLKMVLVERMNSRFSLVKIFSKP